MTCPRCGDPKAYVGLSKVECPNPSCAHHAAPAGWVYQSTRVVLVPAAPAPGTVTVTRQAGQVFGPVFAGQRRKWVDSVRKGSTFTVLRPGRRAGWDLEHDSSPGVVSPDWDEADVAANSEILSGQLTP